MLVRVVRRIHLFVHVKHTSNARVIQGEDQCGIGLKRHALLQSVEVQSCHLRRFSNHGRFRLDDGRQNRDLTGAQSQSSGSGKTVLGPPCVMLAQDAVGQPSYVRFPPHFIRVGNNAPAHGILHEQLGHVVAVGKNAPCGGAGDRTHVTSRGDDHLHGLSLPGHKAGGTLFHGLVRGKRVPSWFQSRGPITHGQVIDHPTSAFGQLLGQGVDPF